MSGWGEYFKTHEDRGVLVVTLDAPDSEHNKLDRLFGTELEALIEHLESNTPDKGTVFCSGKPDSFLVGADLDLARAIETAEEACEVAGKAQEGFRRLQSLPNTIAAIHGPALGGGLEFALACQGILLSDHPKTVVGLPEVKLGLLPAAGGCWRLPARIGLTAGVTHIVGGKNIYPRKAKNLGLAIDVVPHPLLLDAAIRMLADGQLPSRRSKGREAWWMRTAQRLRLFRNYIYNAAAREVRKAAGTHYPAPYKALDAIREGRERGPEGGELAEREAFGQLLTGQAGRSLIHLFFSSNQLKKQQKSAVGQLQRIGVLGAGLMGTGIATVAAGQGLTVRIRDLAQDTLDKVLPHAAADFQARADKRIWRRVEAERALNRIQPRTDLGGMRTAEVVVEAVFEDLELKRRVRDELFDAAGPETIFASNTSSIPIAQIAEGAEDPGRVVGMHFFSPVEKMPLVEVIRGPQSTQHAVDCVVALARQMGKVVIVVEDGPGFYTTRVIGAFLAEVYALLDDGVAGPALDKAFIDFGFPVGPLALSDEVGLDTALKVTRILSEQLDPRFAAPPGLAQMVESGRTGRKSNRGFYLYRNGSKHFDPETYQMLADPARRHMPPDSISKRGLWAFILEAVKCLEAGILPDPVSGDIGAVLGIGFPAYLGGPFHYIDQLGLEQTLATLRALESEHGARFAPTAGLQKMAADRESYHTRTPALEQQA